MLISQNFDSPSRREVFNPIGYGNLWLLFRQPANQPWHVQVVFDSTRNENQRKIARNGVPVTEGKR